MDGEKIERSRKETEYLLSPKHPYLSTKHTKMRTIQGHFSHFMPRLYTKPNTESQGDPTPTLPPSHFLKFFLSSHTDRRPPLTPAKPGGAVTGRLKPTDFVDSGVAPFLHSRKCPSPSSNLIPTAPELKMRQSGSISFPIVLVLSAIAYIYYTTVFVFIDDLFGLTTSQGLMNAFGFSAMAIMCLITYGLAITKDPGRVPEAFVPDIEDVENPIHEIKRKGGELRYCQKCSHYKPPRAHHCRVCKRCVLRMDHHCIWINNCVGHANYKVFFVFVVYAVIACIHSLVLLVFSGAHVAQEDEHQAEGSIRTSYIISGLLLTPLTIALSILLSWHIYLILCNKTTIEYHEGVRAMWLAKKVGNVYRHPYDLGPYENLTSVLGPNIFAWVCPTSKHIGSGMRFKTGYDETALLGSSE